MATVGVKGLITEPENGKPMIEIFGSKLRTDRDWSLLTLIELLQAAACYPFTAFKHEVSTLSSMKTLTQWSCSKLSHRIDQIDWSSPSVDLSPLFYIWSDWSRNAPYHSKM